jgi:GT2 family glycosyltransferase
VRDRRACVGPEWLTSSPVQIRARPRATRAQLSIAMITMRLASLTARAYPPAMATDERPSPDLSVVIATRNRPAMIKDCVAAILDGGNLTPFEIIVVDDSDRGTLEDLWHDEVRISVLRTHANGTSHARNTGIRSARGRWILFTDDDTLPAHGWIDAAAEAFGSDAALWGLDGPVRTLPWDPLYEHSVEADQPGHFWGCNVAYRRDRLCAIGGFRVDRFPIFGEDRDLGIRMSNHGPMGFSEAMVVTHRPRPGKISDFVVKPDRVHADLALHAMELKPTRRWIRLRLLVWTLRWWWRRRPRGLREPRRLARWSLIVVLQGLSVSFSLIVVPTWVQDCLDEKGGDLTPEPTGPIESPTRGAVQSTPPGKKEAR